MFLWNSLLEIRGKIRCLQNGNLPSPGRRLNRISAFHMLNSASYDLSKGPFPLLGDRFCRRIEAIRDLNLRLDPDGNSPRVAKKLFIVAKAGGEKLEMVAEDHCGNGERLIITTSPASPVRF